MNRAIDPQLLIVETADLMAEFRAEVGPDLVSRDVDEIVASVCQALLCSDYFDIRRSGEWIDFNGMRSTTFLRSNDYRLLVEAAMRRFAQQLLTRLQALGVYNGGEFPYFFDSLLPTGDVVLQRLPDNIDHHDHSEPPASPGL